MKPFLVATMSLAAIASAGHAEEVSIAQRKAVRIGEIAAALSTDHRVRGCD